MCWSMPMASTNTLFGIKFASEIQVAARSVELALRERVTGTRMRF